MAIALSRVNRGDGGVPGLDLLTSTIEFMGCVRRIDQSELTLASFNPLSRAERPPATEVPDATCRPARRRSASRRRERGRVSQT